MINIVNGSCFDKFVDFAVAWRHPRMAANITLMVSYDVNSWKRNLLGSYDINLLGSNNAKMCFMTTWPDFKSI